MSDPIHPGHSRTPDRLLAEFQPPTLEDWHAEVLRLLKGKPFEKVMVTETLEGIPLAPIYTSADVAGLTHLGALPGDAPWVRGDAPAAHRIVPWDVAQALPYPAPRELNDALRRALERGQTMVNLVLDDATRAGSDPDQVEVGGVGHGGTSLASLSDVAAALDGVDLTRVGLLLQPTACPLALLGLLLAHLHKRGQSVADLRGCIGTDPLAMLVTGAAPAGPAGLYDELATLQRWAARDARTLRTAWVTAHVYHDAGATLVQELAYGIATAVEHLRQAERRGVEPKAVAGGIAFSFAVGTQFFMEIAKLRAARVLWWQVQRALSGPGDPTGMHMHARTSRLSQTAIDPYVNILRSTTEAIAAVIGGCDSLHVAPFDDALGLPSDRARRLARNTQVVLREEAHLGRVIDPAGGAHFIEALTDELARRAWALFQDIEAAGGMLAALEAGTPQAAVAQVAQRRGHRLATRLDRLVGVTHYPNVGEGRIERRVPDYAALHAARVRDLERHRSQIDARAHGEDLRRLRAAPAQDAPAQVCAVRDAALAGATLAELAGAARAALGAGTGGLPEGSRVVPLGACGGGRAYEALREAVLAWRERGSLSPQVFLANIGPTADYMPRLDFTRSFFQLAGLAVAGDDGFVGAQEAAAAARASGAPIVVIVAPDETYSVVGPELASALKSAERPPAVLVAGAPRDAIETLRAAGVDDFVHLKVDALAMLEGLARRIGVCP
jgi:methylmalonyl-CoA mutase